MIAKLKGRVEEIGEDWGVIDVGGVGYLVFASARTLRRLPGMGESCSLLIETHVREDHIHLYGFIDAPERDWFRVLTTVQGVGAKVGLSILSTLTPDEVARAIAAQDKTALSRASGVGPKLAARIATELKDKAGGVALGPASSSVSLTSQPAGVVEEAVSALVHLGYGRSEAFAVVARQESGDLSTLIRLALKELGQ